MKTTEEMLQEIKDFQNNLVPGITLIQDDQEAIDFCIKLTYEIYVKRKHKFEPNIDK
ncbi:MULTISPECIES: hypothetical protein [Bacillus]|uniref:hypothetical protein n=1 Tax=Bacillus TaxID=1386 RepID=UPI0005A369B1|nr:MULTISPECIES: hypothetical protein [Bacillus cereus group]AJG60406.1 hypothetical protein AW22_5309 [Bacillus cereus D17]QKI12768.1 hypothetical protein FOC91_12485 [Bacillus cereus]USL01978.1 hypothetical protein LIS83_24455 [Bacillus anthracis]